MVRETTYQPQNGSPLRARVHAVQDGARRYSVTVVHYTGAGNMRGAIAWEAWSFRKRGGRGDLRRVRPGRPHRGHQLHITNPDKSLTFAAIHFHARQLYVLEATVPPGSPVL